MISVETYTLTSTQLQGCKGHGRPENKTSSARDGDTKKKVFANRRHSGEKLPTWCNCDQKQDTQRQAAGKRACLYSPLP